MSSRDQDLVREVLGLHPHPYQSVRTECQTYLPLHHYVQDDGLSRQYTEQVYRNRLKAGEGEYVDEHRILQIDVHASPFVSTMIVIGSCMDSLDSMKGK